MITNYIISYFKLNCIKNIVQFRSPITKYCSIYRNLSLFFKKIQFYPTKKRKSLFLSVSLSANACPTMNGGIRSFVRRRKVVRTRIRTPHPSAFGCHLPPLGKALGKCGQRDGGMQAYSASLRGKFASQTLPLPYRDGERSVICAKPNDGANNDAGRRPRRPVKNKRHEQNNMAVQRKKFKMR